MKHLSIAIDGPSGAGKSTFAKRLASDINFVYVDTGAIYRSVGLCVYKNNIQSKDVENIIRLLPSIIVEIIYDNSGVQRMILNGEDVTDEIRLPEISIYASDVSAIPQVREFLLSTQRDFALKYDVIMDGRDIGTVVLPDADLKIYLTADISARAERRYKELLEKGIETTLEEVTRNMIQRDKNDSSRKTAPLKMADGAVLVDTTALNLEESYQKIRSIVKEKLGV